MNVLTLVTKRSVRETEPERRIKMFFTTRSFNPGDIIEIIDGNKKSPAYVHTCDPATMHKDRAGQKKIFWWKVGQYVKRNSGTI